MSYTKQPSRLTSLCDVRQMFVLFFLQKATSYHWEWKPWQYFCALRF